MVRNLNPCRPNSHQLDYCLDKFTFRFNRRASRPGRRDREALSYAEITE
jgi:hypothetical protein